MSRVQLIFQNYQEKITLAFCLIVSFTLIFNNDSDLIKNAKINSLNSFSFLYQPFNWLDNQLFLNKKLEKPRFGSRRCNGIWPPSNQGLLFEPDLEW